MEVSAASRRENLRSCVPAVRKCRSPASLRQTRRKREGERRRPYYPRLKSCFKSSVKPFMQVFQTKLEKLSEQILRFVVESVLKNVFHHFDERHFHQLEVVWFDSLHLKVVNSKSNPQSTTITLQNTISWTILRKYAVMLTLKCKYSALLYNK